MTATPSPESIQRPREIGRYLSDAFWLGFCVTISTAAWAVFYPGLMSFDSVVQYREAFQQHFTDFHPPIMAIILSGVLRLGGDIQYLMFVQCLAGVLGVFQLAAMSARFLTGNHLSVNWARVCAAAVLAALLSPLSPLAFYLMTFWKDVWVMIAFLWVSVAVIDLLGAAHPRWNWTYATKLTALLGLMTVSVMARHNAMVELPVYAVLFAALVGRVLPRGYAVAALAVPPLAFAAANIGMNRTFDVKVSSHDTTPMGMELTAICKVYPNLDAEFPYTHGHLRPEFREKYAIGVIESWTEFLTPGYHNEPDRVRAEYRHAATAHTAELADVKVRAFLGHLTTNTALKFIAENSDNEFGLRQNERFAATREKHLKRVWKTFHHPRRWAFVEHSVWLGANLIVLVGLCGRAAVVRTPQAAREALLPLIPLAYYASYLVVTIAFDFRYMYPSTLLLQVVLLAGCAGWTVIAAVELATASGRRLGRAVRGRIVGSVSP